MSHVNETGAMGARKGGRPPKGRPTPGRKTRNAQARARARRHRLVVRAWWTAGITIVLGVIVALVLTGVGTGGGSVIG